MEDTLLIATANAPDNSKSLHLINSTLRDWAKHEGLTIVGGIQWCEGPGCANLAIRLKAEEDFETKFEKWANGVTWAVGKGMAKWSSTVDVPPETDSCTLNWNL